MQFTHLKTLRILTIILAFSLSLGSIAGAFFPITYERDISQDFTIAIEFGILSFTSMAMLVLLFPKLKASSLT